MSGQLLGEMHLQLIGCGKMGSALLSRWLEAGIPPENVRVTVASETSAHRLHAELKIKAATKLEYTPESIVIFAVKPQILPALLESWNPPSAPPLYLSVAAGITLKTLETALGKDTPIIRAMPNTPSLVGEGLTTLCSNGSATDEQRQQAESLFLAVGKAVWVENETLFDVATAVAGSGPAYVYYFAEALIESARKLGLPEETAREMVNQTLLGSVALAEKQGWDVATLRKNVTSPGGVTEAALKTLTAQLPAMLDEALAANIRRSDELAKS